ncbi:MAG: oxidoreductase [Roseibacillus sp.]|jgi:predicted dehydrogenase|nr:oxidoreductase [Roseibacillus sp.]MBP34044.1 oxidoreductase [Roseibacillus sp.]MCP4731829.1 Gfo/Idh/MocA family oxidoreductase [Roseibacillus sp.]MDP7306163.1 Gfo/Idh/MocA family oxidoreductase [Roseibacillus sp.]HJM65778.1 Gfo/Idh/MocA family oxidoreductase [Roseibacillus sp.]|tara:strand:+ start:1846 stop:3126 length:1281 start_codon:yes stop_codon:yes gene_type:complete
MKSIPRRHFIRTTSATAIAAPTIIPAHVLGKDAPSNRITVGFIGTGGHGTGWNLPAYLSNADARILAACDPDDGRANHAKGIIDRKYGNKDCATTRDFREVLAREDIDAVMISTPDHWHTLMSVMAIRAGKDVQCEKPTLTINEGKLLIDTVRKHNRVFQTSTEDRSVPVYHRMAELVRNGRIGKLQRIEVILPKQPGRPGDPTPQPVPKGFDYDMWLGPAPEAPYTKDRVLFDFRWISDYSGGVICDWGTHLFDTAQWGNDTERSGPVEVEATGSRWEGGLFDTVNEYDVTYRYANGVTMTCRPGNPSIKFIGSEGWVGNTGWRAPLQASSRDILESKIGPGETRLFTNPKGEHRNFLDCVKSRQDPYFPVDIGHRVSTVCHLANIAIDRGRKLKWNPEKEVFIGDDQANEMCRIRPGRGEWKLG